MKTYSFEFPHRVKYYETDQMGYVHNSNYFRFFETGREETMRHLGLSYDAIEKLGVMMPLIEQYAHYHAPARYDDELIIHTTISKIPEAKIHFDYCVYSIQNGKKIVHCKGWNKLCFVNRNTRKPLRCPEFLTKIMEKVLSE